MFIHTVHFVIWPEFCVLVHFREPQGFHERHLEIRHSLLRIVCYSRLQALEP